SVLPDGSCIGDTRQMGTAGGGPQTGSEDDGASRRRLGTSIFLAGVIADAAGAIGEVLDAAEHVAAVALEEPAVRGWDRGRRVEFAGRG
ncbi:hypothetical protein ACFPYM_09025, partial [Methylobacterium hispanicum]